MGSGVKSRRDAGCGMRDAGCGKYSLLKIQKAYLGVLGNYNRQYFSVAET